jgi:hypothetical protein
MPLTFRDFTPRLMAPARGGIPAQWEPVAAVVQRANQWLESSGQRALNVETLLLPLAKTAQPLPSSPGNLERWDEDHQWVQVVRVWIEASVPPSMPPPLPVDSLSNPIL